MTTLPRIVRRQSGISGWGVFAAERIPENTRVVEYKGALITQAEACRREQRYLSRQHIWLFNINGRWARDGAIGGNLARYINHACRPNCYVDVVGHAIWIVTSRSIQADEELTYDYNTEGVAGIICRCRPRCRRIL